MTIVFLPDNTGGMTSSSSGMWRLRGRMERQDGAKRSERTVVELDFEISDETMKKVMKLVVANRPSRARVRARSKTADLRTVFR